MKRCTTATKRYNLAVTPEQLSVCLLTLRRLGVGQDGAKGRSGKPLGYLFLGSNGVRQVFILGRRHGVERIFSHRVGRGRLKRNLHVLSLFFK